MALQVGGEIARDSFGQLHQLGSTNLDSPSLSGEINKAMLLVSAALLDPREQ
jgi:hypothetical protein